MLTPKHATDDIHQIRPPKTSFLQAKLAEVAALSWARARRVGHQTCEVDREDLLGDCLRREGSIFVMIVPPEAFGRVSTRMGTSFSLVFIDKHLLDRTPVALFSYHTVAQNKMIVTYQRCIMIQSWPPVDYRLKFF